MTAPPHTPRRPWYREPYVWLLITFPALAVVGGITTITLAVQSDDGLVADDYYKRGLQINRVLERDRAAARHGLAAEIDLAPAGGRVRLSLEAGEAFRYPPSLMLRLLHATRAGFDQEIWLERSTRDTYAGTLPPLAAGPWHLQIEADDWRLNGSLHTPAESSARLASGTPPG